MLEIPMIEQFARMRKLEIAHEISRSPTMGKRIMRTKIRKRNAVDLNIRVSLQPRLSFSIWVGRGA